MSLVKGTFTVLALALVSGCAGASAGGPISRWASGPDFVTVHADRRSDRTVQVAEHRDLGDKKSNRRRLPTFNGP
jgi:hypothetical protein